MGRLSRDKRDVFYRLAKEKGYRARSAFKLLQLDSEFNLFENVHNAVDLCAAPGSWSQVLADKLIYSRHSSNKDKKKQGKEEGTAIPSIDEEGEGSDVDVNQKEPPETGANAAESDRNDQQEHAEPGENRNEQQRCQQEEEEEKEQEEEAVVPARIVAVDLQPMAPIDGVICIQGDITSYETAKAIVDAFYSDSPSESSKSSPSTPDIDQKDDDGGNSTNGTNKRRTRRAELVICDGAPDVTGLHDIDEYLQSQLLLSAVKITTHCLEKGGTFVAKIFRGKSSSQLYGQLRMLFDIVSIAKPTSSRNSSMESFVVCQHFKGPPYYDLPLVGINSIIDYDAFSDANSIPRAALPFIACGDLSGWNSGGNVSGEGGDGNGSDNDWKTTMDANKSYPMDDTAKYIAPITPPIQPPHEQAVLKLIEGTEEGKKK